MKKGKLLWRLCYLTVVLLSVLTFTPLVIPAGTYRPMWASVPYTLWIGIILTVALVVLTFFATQLYPPRDDEATGLTSDSNSKNS